jgi:hypothetical protein
MVLLFFILYWFARPLASRCLAASVAGRPAKFLLYGREMPKSISPFTDAKMSAATPRPSQWRTHYSLMILTLISMSYSIDRQIIGVLLEPIKKEFLTTDTQMGLLPTSLAYFLWPSSVGIQFLGLEIPQAILFFILMCFFSSWIHAPSTAALNNVIPAHQRSVANAVNLVFYTVLGFGLGPASMGMLSDALTQFAGKEGLRYSLAFLTVTLVISMLFYAKAFKPYLTANR